MPIILQLQMQVQILLNPVDLGNFTASSAINITSANKYLNVNGASLTANGSGTAIDITSKYLSGSGSISTPNGIWRATNTETSFPGLYLEDFQETLSNMVILQAMLSKERVADY